MGLSDKIRALRARMTADPTTPTTLSGSDEVSGDSHVATSRATGGVRSDEDAEPDQGSTTGTGPSEEFVGRVAGQDAGYSGETGAEARREAVRED